MEVREAMRGESRGDEKVTGKAREMREGVGDGGESHGVRVVAFKYFYNSTGFFLFLCVADLPHFPSE